MKKTRIDSSSEISKVMQASGVSINVPDHIQMDDIDCLNFQNIISEQAKIYWTAHKVVKACKLAKLYSDVARLADEIREEGESLKTGGGNASVNPKTTIMKNHLSTIIAMEKNLGLDIRASGRDARDISKTKGMSSDIEEKANKTADDYLIA